MFLCLGNQFTTITVGLNTVKVLELFFIHLILKNFCDSNKKSYHIKNKILFFVSYDISRTFQKSIIVSLTDQMRS